MERLTENAMKPSINSRYVKKSGVYTADCIERLGAYEDTELTPEQLIEIDKLYAELSREVQQYRAIGTVEECREARKRVLLTNH